MRISIAENLQMVRKILLVVKSLIVSIVLHPWNVLAPLVAVGLTARTNGSKCINMLAWMSYSRKRKGMESESTKTL